MKLIDQHTKAIMEGCKERAIDAGLKFDKETLEYMVSNTDLLELSAKNMIPTLYDYWLQDIQVLRDKGEYDIYPNNPYETVINTRPVISFYNDNNPDWLNVMIFYHVLGHIDFFQNNKFFEHTWGYDFKEKALTDKRIIAKLRSKKHRKVDYVIEFSKGIDNLVGYFQSLTGGSSNPNFDLPPKMDYYFNIFIQEVVKTGMKRFLDEIERYNRIDEKDEKLKEETFLFEVREKHPEFDNLFKSYSERNLSGKTDDLLQFIMERSKFLKNESNRWMKTVMEVVRDTSLYFSPMMRTKTMNEGWASYWHEKLFLDDDRIRGHEIAFAKINSKVTSLSKVGLNPYAIGWRLFRHIEEMADQGKLSYAYQKLLNREEREKFDDNSDTGRDFIFHVRENYCDFTFFNTFVEQDFVDKFKLMVVGKRINPEKNVREYYIKSRSSKDYKKMLIDSLYHPPNIKFEEKDGELLLKHQFEGSEIYKDFIHNTMIGIEYLWGDGVRLETTEFDWEKMKRSGNNGGLKVGKPELKKVIYKVKDKKITKEVLA